MAVPRAIEFRPGGAACRARAKAAFADGFTEWRGRTDLVVVGGTATALAMLELKLSAFDSSAIEGLRIGRDRVAATIDLLAGLSDAEKRELPFVRDKHFGRGLHINLVQLLKLGLVESVSPGHWRRKSAAGNQNGHNSSIIPVLALDAH